MLALRVLLRKGIGVVAAIDAARRRTGKAPRELARARLLERRLVSEA
jgi:hypothetical protein